VRRLLILLAAVVVLAAGCGGGGGGSSGGGKPSGPPLTKQAYQAKLQSISAEIAKSIGKTSSNTQKISKADVDKLVKAFHKFADRLAEVNPPAEVKQLHAQLVKTMNDLGDEFPSIADKVNSSGKDPGAAVSALFGAHAVQELVKVGQQFKAKGYNLNLNG